jgi:bacterioferritin-associated ferredoxin
MLICSCSGTHDFQVRAAVRSGASDRRQVDRACRGAGEGCGSCLRTLDALIVEETRASAERRAAEVAAGGLLAAG